VFTPTVGPVDLGDWRRWWRWESGACWREPIGPRSSVADRSRHPCGAFVAREPAQLSAKFQFSGLSTRHGRVL